MTNCTDPDPLKGPYYTHPCAEVMEDHARHIVVHQYIMAMKVPSQWAVPSNESSIWVDAPAVVDVLVGSCLWNGDYGYFRIAAFDKIGQKLSLQRVIHNDTVAPGTVVPSCTRFIITPDPT